MPDVAILSQVRGSNGFTAGGNHLVKRTTSGKLGIKFPTKLTNAAGSCVETMDDGSCDMFHEKRLLGRRQQSHLTVRQVQSAASVDLITESSINCSWPLYYTGWDPHKPPLEGAIFAAFTSQNRFNALKIGVTSAWISADGARGFLAQFLA